MPARVETPSSQLGTLLLRGYTMLAEACPSCNIPLMRDPGTMQAQCVGCHRSWSPAELQALDDQPPEQPAAEPSAVSGPLHTAAPGVTPAAAAAAAAAAGPAAQQAVLGQPATRAMNGPLTSALARNPRRTASNGGSSDSAGSPNLLPAHAPVTPAGAAAAAGTMSPQSTGAGSGQLTPGRAHQDATDEEVLQAYQQIRAERQRGEQQQQHAQPPRQGTPQQQQQQQQPNGVAAGAVRAPGQQADVSQLMADKMLAGWALLGDHCPICSTPLMRERGTRQVYCVACNLPVRLQQQPASGASTDRSALAELAAEQQQQHMGDNAASGLAAGSDAAAEAGAPAEAARQADAAGRMSGQGLSKQQVLDDLHQALLEKLCQARQHLLTIPATQHDQMAQQLQTIHHLLQTLSLTQQQ